MAQYPVPQFIEEEGKIVFFLTFRQFFLLIAAGAICFLMFITLPLFVFIFGSIVVISIFIVIAFVKFNGMPILKVLFNYVGFLSQSKNYIWKKKDWSEGESAPILELPQSSKLEDIKRTLETKK